MRTPIIRGVPVFSAVRQKDGWLHVICLRCCRITKTRVGLEERVFKESLSLMVRETVAFEQEIAPHLKWKHNGQTYTQNFSTIPQSVRQKAIYNLLRESALPDYFNEIHCGASQNCGAMFSVFYRKKRITRVWARDVEQIYQSVLTMWNYYNRTVFEDYWNECEVLCENKFLPFDFSVKNRDKLYETIDEIGADSHIWITANRIGIERNGERVMELYGTGPDYPWLK